MFDTLQGAMMNEEISQLHSQEARQNWQTFSGDLSLSPLRRLLTNLRCRLGLYSRMGAQSSGSETSSQEERRQRLAEATQ